MLFAILSPLIRLVKLSGWRPLSLLLDGRGRDLIRGKCAFLPPPDPLSLSPLLDGRGPDLIRAGSVDSLGGGFIFPGGGYKANADEHCIFDFGRVDLKVDFSQKGGFKVFLVGSWWFLGFSSTFPGRGCEANADEHWILDFGVPGDFEGIWGLRRRRSAKMVGLGWGRHL